MKSKCLVSEITFDLVPILIIDIGTNNFQSFDSRINSKIIIDQIDQ
jgi:hypothetical protein